MNELLAAPKGWVESFGDMVKFAGAVFSDVFRLRVFQFFGESLSKEAPKWNYMMAMSTMMAAPVIALFFIAQRYFIEGITVGGVKG